MVVRLDELLPVVLSTLVFVLIGLVVFAVAFFIVVKVTPFSVKKEIEDDQNTALAIIIGAIIIGVALIISSAIGGDSAPVGEYSVDDWNRVIAVNLSGVFYGMRHQIPAMLDSGGGSIVNVSSILGQVGFRKASAYVAAKHGIVGLTRSAALEYAARKIRVNAVGPAFIRTPLIEDDLTAAKRETLVALHPIGRLGEPAEVAELVTWLSSDKASFVTGAYYAIDGGYLSQ